MRTTAIMNLKGGTGKTVTTINAAAILAELHDDQVLAIDADSQASLTEFLQRGPADGLALGGMSDLLRGMRAMAVHSKLSGVDLLAADETLMALDISAAGSGAADPMALANWLKDREDEYDHVLIDCPPAFNAAAVGFLKIFGLGFYVYK